MFCFCGWNLGVVLKRRCGSTGAGAGPSGLVAPLLLGAWGLPPRHFPSRSPSSRFHLVTELAPGSERSRPPCARHGAQRKVSSPVPAASPGFPEGKRRGRCSPGLENGSKRTVVPSFCCYRSTGVTDPVPTAAPGGKSGCAHVFRSGN
ncbi:hypothetical protein HJG60_009491 [Phyllostomus discolor]|uniref:Uncharacterized protein n=1 Tax=Phyllostomus discolor TaxID=89673 RepID=A0A833Y964_9CHIR|nr:hypothetical protein HJG60_009491 [Phyllostomus discolor]